MKKMNLIALALAGAISLSLLAACAKTDDNTQDTPTPTPSDAVTDTVTPETTPLPEESETPADTAAPVESESPSAKPIESAKPSPKPSEKPSSKPAESEKPSAKPSEKPSPSPAADADLVGFYQTMVKNEKVFNLQEADNDIIDNYYPGLRDLDTVQCHAYVCMMSMNTSELVLVQAKNSDDVSKIKSILQSHIDYMVGDEEGGNPGAAWYPEAIRVWAEESAVVSNGNYVMLVVSEDKSGLISAFYALFY